MKMASNVAEQERFAAYSALPRQKGQLPRAIILSATSSTYFGTLLSDIQWDDAVLRYYTARYAHYSANYGHQDTSL